jgi:nicotinate phosphoribosyltransferase
MFNEHPINSLLETDAYKFSMNQVVLHWFPKTTVKVEFKCRSDVKLGYLKDQVDRELDYICRLRFTEDELAYLKTIPWLSSDYIDYLERFYLKRDQIKTGVDDNGQLTIVAEGPWRDVIHFEIPCLAIVSELYMKERTKIFDKQNIFEEADARLSNFIDKLNECYYKMQKYTGLSVPFTFADFGLRRRFSGLWHDHVIDRLKKDLKPFVGTSNVKLACKYGVKPIGTFAHEFLQSLQGENIRLSEVQKTALDIWAKEYRGELGIALSDNYGFRAFLRDFDKYFAKLFDGCRHDSGDPVKWGEMLISHYKKLGIDPMTKTGCWSDSLDADKVCGIAEHFCGKIKVSFGVGTSLTNNCGVRPLNMVMKVIEANGNPVAKLSDAPGKQMCHDQQYVDYLKKVYQYKSIDED